MAKRLRASVDAAWTIVGRVADVATLINLGLLVLLLIMAL